MPISKSAATKTARIAKKNSPEVAGTRSDPSTPQIVAASPVVTPAAPKVAAPAIPTTASILAKTTQEVILAKEVKPLFFAEQPKDRAVPGLGTEEYEALKANIEELGRILVPIAITPSGIVIDGYARLQIATELDIHCPWVVEDIGDDQIRSLARTLNLARRQLNGEQRRQLIAAELIEDAEAAKRGELRRSFNLIAKKLGVACNTVIAVSSDLIVRGEILAISEAVGADGRVRRAPRPRDPKPRAITAPLPEKPAGTAATLITAPAPAPVKAATVTAKSDEHGTTRIYEPADPVIFTATGPEPDQSKLIEALKEVEPGFDHSGVDLAGSTTVTLFKPEPGLTVATKPPEEYLPKEHPLTEAVRDLFRAQAPSTARNTVDRLLACDPKDVTLADLDIMGLRCGLDGISFVIGVPEETLELAKA